METTRVVRVKVITCDYPGCGSELSVKSGMLHFKKCGHDVCLEHVELSSPRKFITQCAVCEAKRSKALKLRVERAVARGKMVYRGYAVLFEKSDGGESDHGLWRSVPPYQSDVYIGPFDNPWDLLDRIDDDIVEYWC